VTSSLIPFGDRKPLVEKGCFIARSSQVIGDVQLGKDVSVWPMSVIRGDVNSIRIGAGTNIQDSSVLHVTHAGPFTGDGLPLIVGENVTVGHRVLLHACSIGNQCLIGMGAIIMDGAEVQSKVIVGAGSVVTPGKVLVSGHLYLGSPATLVRPLSKKEIDHIVYSAQHYIRLKENYLEQGLLL
jgi:carbonic anhydrase/acetyltransferase-like protein (isoleucine patch superfamily)